MTKKNILIFSAVISTILLIANFIGNVRICTKGGVENYSCLDMLSSIEVIFLPIFAILVFSLITYKMRDEVFRLWLRFVYWWIPFSMFLTLITPNANGGYFVSLWDNEMTAIFSSFIFVIVSTILIIYKSMKTKKV
jgi:hypothetical protein